MKRTLVPAAFVLISGLNAPVQSATAKPIDPAIERWAVAHEVELREHARVTRVDFKEPGIATAEFERQSAGATERGAVTVKYIFVDPQVFPGTGQEQGELLARNPSGFAVLDYDVHPEKGQQR